MRVTIGMISSQYRNSLNNSLGSLNYYSNRATTDRKYNKTSEDPFSASQAYKIRRETQQNEDYTSNVEDASSRLSTGQSAMMTVNTVAQQVSSTDVLQAINGTMSPSDRGIIAGKLRQMQNTIVATANTKYADQYIFGGSSSSTPPFSVENGKLLYRGIDVDTGINTNGASAKIGDSTVNFGKENSGSLNDYQLKVSIDGSASTNSAVIKNSNPASKTIEVTLKSGATNADLQAALQGATYDTAGGSTAITGVDLSKITVSGGDSTAKVIASTLPAAATTSAISNKVNLDDLANEKMYVDLGLGLSFESDQTTVKDQSAFDASMTGISFLGYGTTDKGIPKNMYSLMGTIADKLDPNVTPSFSIDDVQPYIDQFNTSEQNLLGKITESGTKSNFLDYAKTRLETQSDNLQEKSDSVEYVSPADAIMDYKMQDYAYRATLQIGTNILQPTILDFMK